MVISYLNYLFSILVYVFLCAVIGVVAVVATWIIVRVIKKIKEERL
jgi:hypothetical protein